MRHLRKIRARFRPASVINDIPRVRKVTGEKRVRPRAEDEMVRHGQDGEIHFRTLSFDKVHVGKLQIVQGPGRVICTHDINRIDDSLSAKKIRSVGVVFLGRNGMTEGNVRGSGDITASDVHSDDSPRATCTTIRSLKTYEKKIN